MSTSDIVREFDPNLDIPAELKNVVVLDPNEEVDDEFSDVLTIGDNDDTTTVVIEDGTDSIDEGTDGIDGGTDGGGGYVEDALATPTYFTVVSRTYRTGSDGTTVADVVIDIEDITGALNYEVRLTA